MTLVVPELIFLAKLGLRSGCHAIVLRDHVSEGLGAVVALDLEQSRPARAIFVGVGRVRRFSLAACKSADSAATSPVVLIRHCADSVLLFDAQAAQVLISHFIRIIIFAGAGSA